MVRGIPIQQREFFPSARETNWHAVDRAFLDPAQDGRFATSQPSPAHPHALTIEGALRDCVRLPVKEFALIVLLENGEEKTYTSQSLTPCQPSIFSDRFRHDFRRNIRRAATEGAYAGPGFQDDGSMYAEFSVNETRKQSSSGESSSGRSRHHSQRQSRSEDSEEGDSASGKRKRARGSLYSGSFDNDDTPVPVPVQKTQQLTISNDKEVDQFYSVRFKDMQQSSCKVLGKAFVKLVEPKKQTHHPYTKGAAKAPPWWPNTTGENHVRHREPDHLLKPERIRLLVHILKMIIEPYHKQCPTVQKLHVSVKKLEEVTMEAMNVWFNDQQHPENLSKKPFLKEIFKVAKVQERYKNGEIDGDTRVPVMYGDRTGLDVSDDEEEVKDEDEEPEPAQMSTNIPTTDNLGSQPMMQTQHLQQSHEQEPSSMFMPATRPLPVRYHTQPQLEENATYSNTSYLRTVGFQSQSPNPQESSRRSFGSPVYPSPQNMYGWQNSPMVSNGTMPSNYYVTSPNTLGSQGGQFQLPAPPTTQQPMLPPMAQHHFDGLPVNRQFDSGPAVGNQLRTGSLGHPHHMPHGYQEYLQDTGNYGHSDSELRDDQQIQPN